MNEKLLKMYCSKSIKESSLRRLDDFAKNPDCGTISAFRTYEGCGEDKIRIPYKKKMDNHRELRAILIGLGYSVTDIDGFYIEIFKHETLPEIRVREKSLFVVDIKDTGKLKNHLIVLGTMNWQDSITYAKASGEYYLISTNKCGAYPGFGEIGVEVKLGSPMFGKDGEFYSTVRNRPFIFKTPDINTTEIISEFTPTEIRALKMVALQKLNS